MMSSSKILLHTVFHLNLAYSSIEEEQRQEVIRRCYWPILRLAEKFNIPIGIEAPGYTLERCAAIDPAWLRELRWLVTEGPCEFIGSGYAQIIGPLVPADVNAANLRLGGQVYERLLGLQPKTALVSEQAYSAGLVQHYLDAGYEAIIMEWDNPASCHPEWDPEWRYLPQVACGQYGEEIPVIWNQSIAFQKFQRYAHGEMDLEEYLDYLVRHISDSSRAFPLYGNDAEVFDFRPGRYHTEGTIRQEGEWKRLERLFEALLSEQHFTFIRPGQVLELLEMPHAGTRLHLETAEHPIPVKKQGKYNITRWAATGRDDLGLNTACWRIQDAFERRASVTDDEWRELCYYWSSDFRTHISPGRFRAVQDRLAGFEKKVFGNGSGEPRSQDAPVSAIFPHSSSNGELSPLPLKTCPTVKRYGRKLIVDTEAIRVELNCRRGLAIDKLWFKGVTDHPLVGTLPHGYYDDISLGADFYTGHLVLESPGQPQVTDLDSTEPEVKETSAWVEITGIVHTGLGPVQKGFRIFRNLPCVEFEYYLHWLNFPLGLFRVGHITLNPEAFDRNTLFYRTHNGGHAEETYHLAGSQVDHGDAVSSLVSARTAIGLTGGMVELGDATHAVRVEVDNSLSALIGLMTYREVGNTYFCRLALSAGEMDETRQPLELASNDGVTRHIRIVLTASNHERRRFAPVHKASPNKQAELANAGVPMRVEGRE